MRSLIIIGCLLASLAISVSNADTTTNDIAVEAAWVRNVPPVTSTTAGYMQLTNTGEKEKLLVGVRSDIAENIELHNHTMDNGMMRMRRIAHVHLPSGKMVALTPGGMHMMIFRLKKPLVAGNVVELELQFADGSSQIVTAEVK